jgi:hypothetical protein
VGGLPDHIRVDVELRAHSSSARRPWRRCGRSTHRDRHASTSSASRRRRSHSRRYHHQRRSQRGAPHRPPPPLLLRPFDSSAASPR